jgi:hypothetical protein
MCASSQSTHAESLFESHWVERGALAATGAPRAPSVRPAVDVHAAVKSRAVNSALVPHRAGSRHPVFTS